MAGTAYPPHPAGTIWTLGLAERQTTLTPRTPAEFCQVEAGFWDELVVVMGSGMEPEIRRRFAAGRRCYAARVAGRLVAYGWVSFNEEFVGELNLQLHLLPGEAYIWNCVTLPAFRRQHFYSALLGYIVQQLQKEPLARAWIGADFDNTPSQRGLARAGFTHVADLYLARVQGRRQAWVEGLPGIPASLVDGARRVFLNSQDKAWLPVTKSVIRG
jgi:ribosomal protein S18 acetylase RimI-like enzyme